jgi:two-component system, chemotaxis family, CheB/CheR fusion protein
MRLVRSSPKSYSAQNPTQIQIVIAQRSPSFTHLTNHSFNYLTNDSFNPQENAGTKATPVLTCLMPQEKPRRKGPKSKESRAGLPEVSPDRIEQEEGDQIDNIIPTRGFHSLPVVAIGGSAGSHHALQNFFQAMPEKPGVAFVVVLHLSPEHESTMPMIVGRWTKMQVFAATDGMKVEANCVYVIPPGKHLWSTNGHLQLTRLEPERGRRVAVDLFFRSLADTHGPHATAVVLSGADSDGTIGIKRIKERGGLTIAQEPEEAEHHSMPQSAIATGMVDWVLPAAEMPRRILDYIQHERRLNLPPEDGPQPTQAEHATENEKETALREVLAFLRARTGRDFAYYKRATIVRRISRRMQINGIEQVPEYLSFLRMHPGEAGALLQDLLISVTNFFRDRDSFEIVEAMLPELFRGKGTGDMVRVWVPACATGEEAYSMAMMLLEYSRKLEAAPSLQVFGCDLDEAAIQVARAGIYPDTISADVSEERLRRFFLKEPRGYRIRREVREIVLFAAHDLIKDAPFSRMDLVSCRNLLIYLNRDAQKRVLDIFHFALRPNGILFLGSSESVEEGSQLFEVIDKKHRLYRHRAGQKAGIPVPFGSSTLIRAIEAQEQAHRGPVLPGQSFTRGIVPANAESGRGNDPLSLGELHFRLVERIAPPSVVVNAEYDVIHLSENAGKFLQFAGGEPTMNLLRVVHPMLRVELRAALFQAAETSSTVELARVPVDLDGQRRLLNIRVSPARELAPGYLLVVFETVEAKVESEVEPRTEPEPVARQLEREIEAMKTRLRDTVEQYEANTEELKASNEELQAMNEELRSATEELETSREELQSINEELATVNQELKSKLEELGHSNSDLHNLMGATDIATVFLDRELRIMRYTPSAVGLFSIIPSDVGRPLEDLRHQLEYPEMTRDALRVLENLTPVEREVPADGRWYLARFLPYRTLDDRIAGVVLAFVDITEGKRAAEALRQSEERLRLILESAKDYAIFTLDLERKITSWHSGAQAMFGYGDAEIVGKLGDMLFVPEDRERGAPAKEFDKARKEGRAENERWHLRKDKSRFFGSGLTHPLRDPTGAIVGFVTIMRDLTAQKQGEEAMRQRHDELERFNKATVGRELRMVELKKEINELAGKLGEPARYEIPSNPNDE